MFEEDLGDIQETLWRLMENCWFLKQTHPRDLFQFKLVTEFFVGA